MYIPDHFSQSNVQEVYEFIEHNAFGQLVSTSRGKLNVSHLPFIMTENKKCLLAHFARQNPHWENIQGLEVLVSFLGPHAYISPAWYESPGVPTWNYQSVHVYGVANIFHDTGKLRGLVKQLTTKNEKKYSSGWQPDFPESMLKAIVGVEITINDLQMKNKLSQNRSLKDRNAVIEKLKQSQVLELAQAMQKEIDREET